VVRAYLPAQDIKDGVITIQIVEAVFGGTQLEGKAKRVSEKQILRRVEAQQTKGRLLNADALDRAMLLADDLPGVGVAGALSQGKEDGETDLILKLNDEALMNGDANLDNTGSRSTGRERFAANINLSSPFKLGDLLNSSLIHTQGSNYARLGYSVPVGAKGLRIGASASHLGYKLISSDFAGLGGKGTSNSAGIEASYPLIRSRLKNLYYSLNADHKSFDNEFSGATTSQYRLNNLSVGLNGNLFDNLGGGGSNAASLAVVTGRRINRIGTTDQRYSKLRYSFSRQQVISQQVSLLAALSGQESRNNLDSSERFYLGGASGVRAYPTSEASGSSGTLANIELRWRLPHDFSVSGFYDYGQVRNKDGSLSYSLEGAGLAAAWQSSFGLNLKASWARRIGDNPNPVITGNDQDGSLVNNRFWLTANQSF